MNTAVPRAWSALAPKLVAFLATGLTASGLIWALTLFGISFDPGFAALIVAGVSSVAAYIQKDALLALPWTQFAPKVVAFVASSLTGAGVVAFFGYSGVVLDPTLASFAVTVVAALVGYWVKDSSPAYAR